MALLAIALPTAYAQTTVGLISGTVTGGIYAIMASGLVLFAYAWLALSMVVAYAGKAVEPRRFGRPFSTLCIYIAGYGPLLCACTFASYVKELRGAEMTWDKTEKTGKVAMPA